MQARKLGQGQYDEAADSLLFTGPVAQPFVKGQRPSSDASVPISGDESAVVAAAVAVGGDGGGAGEADHRRVVFPLGLGALVGAAGHLPGRVRRGGL